MRMLDRVKYVTFDQALLAVGLVGLTIALTYSEGSLFAIAAALLVEDGPSIVAPLVLLAVSAAIPFGLLAVVLWRMGPGSGGGEGAPLTYPQARLIIGLAGLMLLVALTPQVLIANSAADDVALDSFVYLAVAGVIVAAILGSALQSLRSDAGPFDRSRLLICLGLIALIVVAAVAPALSSVAVTGAEDDPELRVLSAKLGIRVYAAASLLLTPLVLLGLRLRGDLGTGPTVAVVALLAGIAVSAYLYATFLIGVPLAVLAVTSYFAARADGGTTGPVRSGPLLVSLGVLGLLMSASNVKYVITLFEQCADYHMWLYLGPLLALLAAFAFNLGILAAAVWELRAGTASAEADTGA